jgi:hypothetical protein
MITANDNMPSAYHSGSAESNLMISSNGASAEALICDSELVDAAEVQRTLSLLLPPGQVTELRILKGTMQGERSVTVLSGYFDRADELVHTLGQVEAAAGIYTIPNPIKPELLARAKNRLRKANKTTADHDISARRWLLIDCDPTRPAGISATDEEHDAAIQRANEVRDYLTALGWPEPIVADSGNGAHLLYPIDLFIDDAGLVKSCLEALAARFDDDEVTIDRKVHNPARIWKLYGTRACKGDSTADRPHRMSKILSAPELFQPVQIEKLEELAAGISIQSRRSNQQQNKSQAFHVKASFSQQDWEVDEQETRSPITVCMADVQPELIEWLWPGRIAIGKVNLLSGDPGLGKSLVTLDVAARVTRGTKWPDEKGTAPLGSVILLSAEDDAADTLRPRLDAHGADCQKIHELQAVKDWNSEGECIRAFDLSRDIEELRKVIDRTSDCRLVVIDPISAYLGKADSHVNADVRAVLAPLAQLAAQKRVAIVAVNHLRKGDGAAIHRGMGSMGFVAAARAAWVVAKDKDDPRRRLFLAVKNNLADDSAATGLAYTVEGHGPNKAPTICWEPEPVTITADEALEREPKKRGRPPEEVENAMDFLRKVLAGGPRKAKEIQAEASEAHAISKKTLERAKEKLGVEAFQPEIPGPWYWRPKSEKPF